mgnify:CR=1 FL=1
MSTSFVRVGGVARMALWVCLGLLAVLDAPGATRWGLLVGINDYAPGYASSLNCCVNDAEGMRDTVMLGDAAGRWPSANIQLLTNSQATKASIRSALQTLAAQAGAGDVVVYYHSSHGGQYTGTSTFICAYNTDYSDTELGADLARFNSAVSVVVILDTCHSAGMFKGGSWAFAENAMASFRAEKARQFAAAGLAVPKALGGNIGFMTACDYNELSWESPPHGFFTGAILRACDDASVDANGDGELQFMELHNYAAAATADDQTAQHLNAALLDGIAALAAPGGTGISDDEYEENDIRATAFDLSLHEQTWLSAIDGLGVQADDDWFKITVAPGYLRVLVDCEFTHADGNIDIALVDSTGSSLATSEGSGDVENIDFVVPESGVYYIRVHQGNAGNTYDLRWRDALDDSKPDLVIESIAHSPANPVANDVVTFTVTVRNQGQGAAAAVFNVAFWPDRASAPTISTASALSKDYNLGIAPGQAATLQFAAAAPTAGTYTAWAFVDRFQGASEIVEEDEANNAGPPPVGFSWSVDDRYEPNDARASAFDLSGHAGTWLSEIDGVAVQGDDDWYRIEAGAAVERLKAECRFVHAEGDINLALYDSTGVRVDLSAGLTDGESIDFEVPGPGTYYLCVVGPNARSTYDLRWDVVLRLPVHRFWSDQFGAHFYVMGDSERDRIAAKYPGIWRYETVAWYAYPTQAAGTQPVHRFWSDQLGKHFYIMGDSERDRIAAKYPGIWRYETVAWYAYPAQVAGTDPVGRFWSDRLMGHFYTITQVEIDRIAAKYPGIWNYETVAYWAFTTPPGALRAATASAPSTSGLDALSSKNPGEPLTPEEGEAAAGTDETAHGVIFPLAPTGSRISAFVHGAAGDEPAQILDGAESPAEAVFAGVEPDRDYRFEVWQADAEGGRGALVHASSFEHRADAPDGLGDVDAAQAVAGTGVGNPVERIVAPAGDGRISLKLWSAARGVVETRSGVAGGETVEFAIPDWNCWHWVGGWRESDDALVLSLWLRHELD